LARRARLGLRARLALLGGGVALILGAALALGSWLALGSVLQESFESRALAHAATAAQALEGGLDKPGAAPPAQLLERIERPPGTLLVLWHRGRWSSTAERDLASVRPQLLALTRPGPPHLDQLTVGDDEMLAIDVPLGGPAGHFFELAPMTDLEHALRVLVLVLLSGTVALALVAAALGWLAGQRALAPLAMGSNAAEAAARGRPHPKLPAEDDPDLGPLTRSFNATTEALRRRVQSDVRFAADVSHELRTPLTTMLTAMEVIEAQRDRLPPRAAEAAELLSAELDRFHHLVLDLLEMSRAEDAEHTSTEPLLVGAAVRRAADAAAGRPVTRVEQRAATTVLDLDRRRLEAVVGNLVRNAEQHGAGCTDVQVDRVDHVVRIVVDDAGPGIPDDRRSRVMERFFTTDSEGSGLGLPIVEAHLRALRGTLAIEDRPGGGTRVVVSLPRGRT
jgi:signal transduction histidine kinase